MGLSPLTSSERERVEAAIESAERRTGAGLALVIVPISDRYELYAIFWAAVMSISALGVAALFRPDYSILAGFLITSVIFIALTLILDWKPLRMLIVPAKVKRRRASELAHREFAVRLIARAENRNGIMLFVSVAERYVEIFADREIHQRVGGETWNRMVADFVRAVRENRVADGLISALNGCAAVLEAHYPRSRGDSTSEAREPAR
jgi:putative membrane protein